LRWIFSIFSLIDRAFAKLVQVFLIAILLSMTLLVVGQVVLRNVFASGIVWGDVAARHMVLWVAFLGAMLATRGRKHLAIDAVTRLLPRRLRNVVRIILDTLACFVSFLLARASLVFVLDEKAMGMDLISGVPAWVAQTVIPFGFAMIALEYAIGVVLDIWRIATNGSSHVVAGRGRA
jgi:TRAP-type C4-dicarboxylate transport system permease small subunit